MLKTTHFWPVFLYIMELLASILGIIYIILVAQKKTSAWIWGILSCAIFAGLCFESTLIYQGIIQTMNVILGIVAWFQWNRGMKTVRSYPLISIVALCVLLLLLISMLVFYFNGKMTFDWVTQLDRIALLYSVVATYLTLRLIKENWHLWLLINGVTAYTGFENGLVFYAGMSLIYFIISFYGLFQWKKAS